MHEASIAASLLETVCNQCRKEGYGKILQVRVKVGNASGILADALAFAFDCAKKGTEADSATLLIETVPLAATCLECHQEVQADKGRRFLFTCPACGSNRLSVTSGSELQVIDMDVDE